MENKTSPFDLKKLSLDVWERCLFWLFAAYVLANVGWVLGFSWFFLFITIVVGGVAAVIYMDGLTVDPKGKAVLITGCDTGFGFNSSKKLHALGYTVFATVLSKDSDGAKALQKAGIHVIPMNVTSDQDVQCTFEYVKNNLGSVVLWAVISNAGWSTFGDLEMVPISVYQTISEINIMGTIRVVKAFLPLIRKAKGRVITVSSMMGRFGAPSRSPYCCTKWAIQGFSECLRAEMKRWGVHVSVIEPGNFIAGTAIYAGDAIKKQADHMWNHLSQEIKDDYGKESFDANITKMMSYIDHGVSDIDSVVKAYCDAVSHVHPQTRYQIMTLQEKVKCFMATHSPSVFYDLFYN